MGVCYRKRDFIPEVVYAADKTDKDLLEAASLIYENNSKVLITRLSEKQISFLENSFLLDGHIKTAITPDNTFALSYSKEPIEVEQIDEIAVITAGSSDVYVLNELVITFNFFGYQPKIFEDRGVASIDRLLEIRQELENKTLIIAIAGMEATLPTFIASLTNVPVIAVPTSIGYGVNFGGINSLMTCLGACVPGIAVFNIDNGFSAAIFAYKLLSKVLKGR